MPYQITITKQAAKDLADVPSKERDALTAKIAGLANEPRPQGSKKLKGLSDTHRIRQGDYRAVYTVDDGVKIVKVEKVGHRKEIYD